MLKGEGGGAGALNTLLLALLDSGLCEFNLSDIIELKVLPSPIKTT